MTRAVLPTPATPSYCAAMTVGTMVKRFAHWGRFVDSGNQVGRTRSDIHAAGPRRCQSQIVLLLLGCKAGLMSTYQVH